MIYLNQEVQSIFNVDPDLVVDYKRICDRFLISMRHNLTKQLIAYGVYYDLQQINNTYFVMIDKLLNGLYEDVSYLDKDYAEYVKWCNTFLKNSENIVPDNIHKLVEDDINSMQLALNKLIYILKNFCIVEDAK